MLGVSAREVLVACRRFNFLLGESMKAPAIVTSSPVHEGQGVTTGQNITLHLAVGRIAAVANLTMSAGLDFFRVSILIDFRFDVFRYFSIVYS